jgi:XapX domain-containing protein
MKPLLGLALAFVIGFACRAFGIPSPAPPVLVGALLVVAMTSGYLLVDRRMSRPAQNAVNCGGPDGRTPDTRLSETVTSGDPASGSSSAKRGLVRIVDSMLLRPWVRFIALAGLCAAYLQGGLDKLADFSGAVAEAQHFGLPFPAIVAVATIITELVGSALVLTGLLRWLGALWLGTFTLAATFVANRFWEIELSQRFMAENAFFEHLGLVGGFLLVAWYDLRERYPNLQER